MTDIAHLTNLRRLVAMRHRLAQRDLLKAAETERRRAEIAKDGRDHQYLAERTADNYVSLRFAQADFGTGAERFFTSLADGHHHAEQTAVLLARRADRMAERHTDAVVKRGDAARHLLRCQQRLSQHTALTDNLLGHMRAAEEQAEEEENQEVRVGGGQNEFS